MVDLLRNLTDLPWESRFVQRMPGDPQTGNHVRRVRDATHSEVRPTPVASPRLLAWSDRLGAELGVARPSDGTEIGKAAVEALAGNRLLPGMRPYSARYGGHQFGQWAGQLGDGRAITLGEITTPAPGAWSRVELQLKGAGPTPYSRRADGRAVLRSSVREFLCSEAMHFLGVPTTRALSLVTTGDAVVRDMFYDGNPQEEPGAIVCRVAPSFLRFGNFEILTASEEFPLLKRLADGLIEDHYPEIVPALAEGSDPYGKLLDEIARRTARTIAHWMRVGFVHGVMNTDNMSALGLTIDYGPYGWLEPYDPDWTPNTTDAEGRRYRFGTQPGIAQWNLARLCESLSPLVGQSLGEAATEARLQEALRHFQSTFQQEYVGMLAAKLGWDELASEDDQKLVTEMFSRLASHETDYTIFFRALSEWDPQQELARALEPAFYSSPSHELAVQWNDWGSRYLSRARRGGADDEARRRSMKLVNPKYVLRNYLAQKAIDAASQGDATFIERLLRVLERPYEEQPGQAELAERRPEWARNKPGCSALSCSS